MNRQIIAVDIDDVLASSAPALVEFSNNRWGTNLTVDDYNEDWAVMWQVDRQTESDRAQEIDRSRVFQDVLHNNEAYEVLKELAKRYELVIATSRIYKIRGDTLEWLDRHFKGMFADVHHTGIFDEVYYKPLAQEGAAMKTKAGLIRRIGADYLIDDQPKHCLAVADQGMETVLFGDYGWNRNIGPLPPRVSRCRNWQEVGEYFAKRD